MLLNARQSPTKLRDVNNDLFIKSVISRFDIHRLSVMDSSSSKTIISDLYETNEKVSCANHMK